MIAVVLVDGAERTEVEHGTDLWRSSMEWARFHGLDPDTIPAGSEVVRDAPGRRILYTSFVKDGPGPHDIKVEGGDAITVDLIEQGEAPPLPFPLVSR